jgi:serine/threonine protein kinase
MQVQDDLTLIKLLGKGSFGEVYLSTKKGRNRYFATKKIKRQIMDKPSLKKYFENEIEILKQLDHQNIVRLEEIKKTNDYYFIVMEYINGGGLSDCLKKYMKLNNNKAFPEQIVQHLMKQIIETLYYIHSRKIIHRDLKLDNIMVNFYSNEDKENLDMMKARIKIIDFGFAIQLDKKNLTYTAVGSPINMDPIILNKFAKRKDVDLGYDTKADIWSIGTVCYELLTGKAVFAGKTIKDLADKVDKGNYSLPKSLSQETVSFLNVMLQYDSKSRYSAEELLKHPFLTKNVNFFTKFNQKNTLNNPAQLDNNKRRVDKPIVEEEYHKKITLEKKRTTKGKEKIPKPLMDDYIINRGLNKNNNNNNDNKDTQKFLHKAQTFQNLPTGYLNYRHNISPNMKQNASPRMGKNDYNQNIAPRMGLPQMTMKQQPSMGYAQYGVFNPSKNNIVAYQNNEQKVKAVYTDNNKMQYQNKNVNNHYYQYNTAPNVPNQNQDDGCCIQ